MGKPDHKEISSVVAAANVAAHAGARLRRELRRKVSPGAPVRQQRLVDELEALSAHGHRLRVLSGHIQWGRVSPGDELRLKTASAAVDRERRKLRKMLR